MATRPRLVESKHGENPRERLRMYKHNLVKVQCTSGIQLKPARNTGRSMDGSISQTRGYHGCPHGCVSDLLGRHSRAHPVLRSPIRLIEPSCEVKRHVDSHVRTKLQNRSWAAGARTHKKGEGQRKALVGVDENAVVACRCSVPVDGQHSTTRGKLTERKEHRGRE